MGRDHGDSVGRMSALPVSRRSSETASQGTIHILERHTQLRVTLGEWGWSWERLLSPRC
jgi:hypothetical protein